jgi:hypothetical protein
MVRAFSTDGMLMAGDLNLKSGQVVDVEIDLGTQNGPVAVTAEVRRGLGAAFLRFAEHPKDNSQRQRLLEAVGCPAVASLKARNRTAGLLSRRPRTFERLTVQQERTNAPAGHRAVGARQIG